MALAVSATLLLSLDAVVLDTETTGLDARTARLVQIGAIRIAGADIDHGERFESLVNPGIPIPAVTTAVHGITDARVRDAPRFAAVAPALADFLRSSVVIGHAIGYDLAVLRREHDLAGLAWRPPRALDVRQLARLAAPGLAHYNLDGLCAWLGIDAADRHTAMGDAVATARVFAALLPLLRQNNIRTLAEAEKATHHLLERDAGLRGGLSVAGEAAGAEDTAALVRIDSFPYRHRVRDVMSAPVSAPPSMPLADAARLLIERKISSAFVQSAGETGIITERDLLRAIAADGAAALDRPLADIMTTPLQSISADAFLYRAIGRMDRLGLRHLAVRDQDGEIVGALTSRNLLRQRASAAIMIGDEIESARSVGELGRVWTQLPIVARGLLDEDVDSRVVAGVISSEIRALTRRAAEMAEARMAEAGLGPPPVPYCVLVLGSAGRGESLLAADQDNAIVYEHGEPGGAEDRWFEAAARHMTEILDAVGVHYCQGGVMASNKLWRHSVRGWRTMIDEWVGRQRPEDLLNVDIFFDGLPVHGSTSLGHAIWRYAYEAGEQAPGFIKMLSLSVRDWTPSLTFFGGIRTDGDGRVDLKKGGLMSILVAGRALSIHHGVQCHATPDRLRGVAAKGIGSAEEIEQIVDSHGTLLRAILLQQLADVEQGVPRSSRVDLKSLDKPSRAKLREALDGAVAAGRVVDEGLL
jgi:CBS domain-containing protein